MQIRLLHGILGLAVVFQDGARGAEEHPIVPAHQLLEGAQVAGLDLARERGIARGGFRERPRYVPWSRFVPDS